MNKKNKKTKISKKYNYFNFLVYPESVTSDWIQSLENMDEPICISPIHNMDKNEDGTEKKEHYHVIFISEKSISIESLRIKLKRVLGSESVKRIQPIENIKQFYKYLIHDTVQAQSDGKYKYDENDLIHLNGFNIEEYIYSDLTKYEKNKYLNQIIKLIIDYRVKNIIELNGLIQTELNQTDVKNTFLMNQVIKGNVQLLKLYFDGNYQNNRNIEVAK